jgi:hypothetical protein
MKMKQFKEPWPTLDGPGTYNNKRSALKQQIQALLADHDKL